MHATDRKRTNMMNLPVIRKNDAYIRLSTHFIAQSGKAAHWVVGHAFHIKLVHFFLLIKSSHSIGLMFNTNWTFFFFLETRVR